MIDETHVRMAIEQATLVRRHAYAPYSNFHVGAALVAADGTIYRGCNVENASYGLTQCAERAAVTAATADANRAIVCCVVIADTPEPITPCGACRQVLAEVSMDMVVVCRTLSGQEQRFTMHELLPSGFAPSSLPPS